HLSVGLVGRLVGVGSPVLACPECVPTEFVHVELVVDSHILMVRRGHHRTDVVLWTVHGLADEVRVSTVNSVSGLDTCALVERENAVHDSVERPPRSVLAVATRS